MKLMGLQPICAEDTSFSLTRWHHTSFQL